MWIKYIQSKFPVYVTQIDEYAQTEKLCATLILSLYVNRFCLLVEIRLV